MPYIAHLKRKTLYPQINELIMLISTFSYLVNVVN